jgi:hypothetical protein
MTSHLRVGAPEDPILPSRQAREGFRFHGLGPNETKMLSEAVKIDKTIDRAQHVIGRNMIV